MNKVVRNGYVAVLYSPDYGAGWSTWGDVDDREAMVFCPELVEAVERDATYKELERIANRVFPGEYTGGLRDLLIEWVPEGQRFEIAEYDGFESVRLLSPDTGFVA